MMIFYFNSNTFYHGAYTNPLCLLYNTLFNRVYPLHAHAIHLIKIVLNIIFTISCFQGVILSHNTSARIITSNQSLVLQKVTKQSAGKYTCAAINSEGDSSSNELDFRVKCECLQLLLLPSGSYLNLFCSLLKSLKITSWISLVQKFTVKKYPRKANRAENLKYGNLGLSMSLLYPGETNQQETKTSACFGNICHISR